MSIGRLFFAGAVLLGLAYFALRAPLPAADPRFVQQDVADAGAPLSLSAYLDGGVARERGQAELAAAADALRRAAPEATARAAALDEAARRLAAAGIGNVMLRFGSCVVVRGRRGAAPWRIGLRDPSGRHDALAYLLADRDEAVASHGVGRAVTVVGADAAAAAAAAGALHRAGADWVAAARQRDAPQVLVVEADGAVAVTPALAGRLKFLHGIEPEVRR